MAHQRVVRTTVYKGRTNAASLSVKERFDGAETDVDFSDVERMVLTLDPNGLAPVVVDTDEFPNAIDFSELGVVELQIGLVPAVQAMPEGWYPIRLAAVDVNGNRTELINEDGPQRVLVAVRDTSDLP